MDIDLTAGLLKPKIALTELPAPVSPDIPEAALPDFTALLNGPLPDDTGPPETIPLLEELSIEAPATLQAQMPLGTIKDAPEIKSGVDTGVKITPEKAAEPIIDAEPPAPDQFIAPLQAHPNPSPSLPLNTAETSAISRVSTQFSPAHPITVAAFSSAMRTQPEPATTPHPRGISGETQTPDALANQPDSKATIVRAASILAEESISPRPEKPMAEPRFEPPTPPANPSPNSVAQSATAPAPIFGLANEVTPVDDPAELQFNIKVERQSVDVISTSRSAPHAAPVASQITAQLPQMLTKAEKQTVELRLDPPELGRVTIHLTTNDNQVTAQVVAERVDTVDLMRRHAELLTATLARAGFSEADLSFQQGQGQHDRSELEQFQSLAAPPESDETSISPPTLIGQDGRLDIRL